MGRGQIVAKALFSSNLNIPSLFETEAHFRPFEISSSDKEVQLLIFMIGHDGKHAGVRTLGLASSLS